MQNQNKEISIVRFFVYLLNFFKKAIDFDGLKGYNPNINSDPIGSCLQLNALSRK